MYGLALPLIIKKELFSHIGVSLVLETRFLLYTINLVLSFSSHLPSTMTKLGATTQNDPLVQIITTLTQRIDSLTSEVAELKTLNPPKPSSSSSGYGPGWPPKVRLDCPRFDGSAAMDWLFAANRFFEYHQISDADRLHIVSFYLEGPALCWFQWVERNGLFLSWSDFVRQIEHRFAPSSFRSPQGRLCKLQQTGSVSEYLTEFESLANRIVGVPPPFILECFISGLKPPIQHEVLALRPVSLTDATELAKLQEERFAESRQARFKSPSPTPPPPSAPLLNARFVERKGFVTTVRRNLALITAVRVVSYCFSQRTTKIFRGIHQNRRL